MIDPAPALRDLCGGAIALPGDDGYDAARQAFNLAVDQRPAAVAYPADEHEVAAIVRTAREPLTRAHELAEVCGAERLLAGIRRELLAVGVEPASAMPHGVASLTATERRVAALAAAGRAEREIAQELFVTPRIIQIKLGSALRKLGASSPGELAMALET